MCLIELAEICCLLQKSLSHTRLHFPLSSEMPILQKCHARSFEGLSFRTSQQCGKGGNVWKSPWPCFETDFLSNHRHRIPPLSFTAVPVLRSRGAVYRLEPTSNVPVPSLVLQFVYYFGTRPSCSSFEQPCGSRRRDILKPEKYQQMCKLLCNALPGTTTFTTVAVP